MVDINERVAKLEARTDEQGREIKEIKEKLVNQDKLVQSVAEMANSMKYIQKDIQEVKEDVKDTKDRVNQLEDRPGKASLGAWKWILGIIGGGVLGYILNILLATVG